MEVFRAKFLEDNVLGITPVSGYNASKNHSMAADSWLDWLQFNNNITIKREYKIGKFWADGYNEQTRTVYEFFGCKYHGCHCYYPDNRDEPIDGGKTPNTLYQ